MCNYNTTLFKGHTYLPLTVIANAFCLDSNLVEDMAMSKDRNDIVEIINDQVMIPFEVFKRMNFPQDKYFFKIVAAYLRGEKTKGV